MAIENGYENGIRTMALSDMLEENPPRGISPGSQGSQGFPGIPGLGQHFVQNVSELFFSQDLGHGFTGFQGLKG